MPTRRFPWLPLCRSGIGVLLLVIFTAGSLASEPLLAQDTYSRKPTDLEILRAVESTLEEIIKQTEPSVVSIARYRVSPAVTGLQGPRGLAAPNARIEPEQNRPDHPGFIPNEFGSGLIFRPTFDDRLRLILTNYHVIRSGAGKSSPDADASQRIFVRFSNGRGCLATIIAADPRSDLAVLKPDLDSAGIAPETLTPAQFGTAETLRRGQLVVAISNPYAIGRDGQSSATWGMISNIGRSPARPASYLSPEEQSKRFTIHHFGTLLQLDVRLELGSSGGAVVNLNREVIGMTTALAALEGYEKSAGFAVSFDTATRRIIDDLSRGYEPEYGLLGVGTGNADPVELQQFPERFPSVAKVMSVNRNSPADRAGLMHGDLILKANGRDIRSDSDLIREIGLLPPEAKVQLGVWRPRTRESLTVEVTLGKWPVHDDEGVVATQTRPGRTWRGITIDYPTGRKKHIDDFEYQDAVLVTGLQTNIEFLHEGAFIARVDDQPVRTPDEFRRVVESREGDPVRLQIVGGPEVTIPPQAPR